MVDSDGGQLHLEVRSAPQPPVLGVVPFRYLVTDLDGLPVEDLVITVVPYMPDMDMGPTVQPTVREKGRGVYDLEDVDLVMEGEWELQTTFAGPVDDEAAPSFPLSSSD